jgi:hemoglobin/transferrin/lactoferrin receptor protein
MQIHRSTAPSRPQARTLAALVSLACLHMVPAHAQSTAPRNAHAALPEMVVSGSRSEQLSDELPLSIDVIDARALSDQQSRDVREALRDLPNTSVKHPLPRTTVGGANTVGTGRDGNVGLNIRGLGGNRVLMLVDGIRVPRSYAFRTTTFDREYLSMELLKRIEVVRGPASALYGSDGMAGLVNFITHEPADFLTSAKGAPPKQVGGRISAGWSGDDNGRALAATVAGTASDTVQWLVTANARRSHAMDNMGTRDTSDTSRTTPNPQHNEDNAVLAKVVLRPSAAQRHVVTLEHVEKQADVEPAVKPRAPAADGQSNRHRRRRQG